MWVFSVMRWLALILLANVASTSSSNATDGFVMSALNSFPKGLVKMVALKWPGIQRTATYLHLKRVITPSEVMGIVAALPEDGGVWDEDADSVDGMASFEFVLRRKV